MSASYQPGDILLVHGTDLLSRLIGWGTRSHWCHVALIVSAAGDLIEALNTGVTRTTLAKYAGHEVLIVNTRLSAEDRARAVAYATARVGDPYGWLTIAGIVIGRLTGLRLILGLAHHEDCSWMVGEALAHAGVDFNADETMTTPADLAAYYAVTPR
jgi:uncharacterized protein YycO